MNLQPIIDDLREARRYVRSNPAEACRLVEAASSRLRQTGIPAAERPARKFRRILENLAVGARFAVAAPGVFAGYTEGAAFELEVGLDG